MSWRALNIALRVLALLMSAYGAISKDGWTLICSGTMAVVFAAELAGIKVLGFTQRVIRKQLKGA